MEADQPSREDQLRELNHDLQTSLHAIGMGLELLKEVRLDEAQFAKITESIDKERKNATNLVKELMQFVHRSPNP